MSDKILELESLIEGFRLSCHTEGKSSKTIEWYECFLMKFRQFLHRNELPTGANQIEGDHVKAFIRYLMTDARVPRKNTNLSPATIQGYVRTLKAFFSWLEREGYISANPMTRIPIPKAPTKIIDTFTVDQIGRLTEVIKGSNGNGYRDLCMVVLMLDCGIRVSEMVNISLEDVNLTEGHIRITEAKGGRERVVPIGSLVQKSLWKYAHYYRPEPLVDKVTTLFLSDRGLPLTRNSMFPAHFPTHLCKKLSAEWGRHLQLAKDIGALKPGFGADIPEPIRNRR
jgi:site-specific recombinase XerD